MQPVEELIASHSIAVVVRPADENPHMPHPGDDLDHWRCTISAEGVEAFEVHVSLHHDYGGVPPRPDLVMSLVMADVRSYRACEGYADFAAMLGVEDGEDDPAAAAAWEELGRLSASVAAIESLSVTPVSPA